MPVALFSESVPIPIDQSAEILSEWITVCCQKEKCSLGEVNFIFCDDPYLLSMNQQFLDHDHYTDVITFDYSEDSLVHGDIFISVDTVRDNAVSFENTARDEFHRVMIHGVLHLIGYQDKSEDQQRTMRSKEDFYLSLRPF